MVVHTEQVLSEIYQARGLIIDHETALRAHLVAADRELLDPYRAAEKDLSRRTRNG
jgi:CHASE3 domain sensor protein